MAYGTTSSASPESGFPERDLGIVQRDRILFAPEIKRLLDKSTDTTAFDATIAASIFLFSLTENPVKSLPVVARLLDRVDFNNKEVFPEHSHSAILQLQRDIYVNLAIGLQEQETGIAFDSSIDNTIFLGTRAVEKFGRMNFHGTNTVALEGIKRSGSDSPRAPLRLCPWPLFFYKHSLTTILFFLVLDVSLNYRFIRSDGTNKISN